jgi:glycosyltransferase involved in cell wall biosynthesis
VIERGILYIADTSTNGVKQNIYVLLKYLNRARYQPYLVMSSDSYIAERLREVQVQYKVVPEITTAGKFNVGNVVKQIEQFVDEHPINLVHSHDYQGCFVGNQVAKLIGVPHVCTLYTGIAGEKKKKGLFAVPNEKIIKGPDHLIAISEEVKSSVSSINEVTLIYNAIEADRFVETLDTEHLTRELELDKDDILVGTVTKIASNEEIKLLFDVANILISNNNKIHFAIAGDGQDRENLKKIIEEMDIKKNIHLLGYRRDVAHVLKSLDVVLIANKRNEIPLILLEALAGIRPVVVLDTPGIREVVTEECAKFAKTGDPKALAEAVEYMLSNRAEAESKASIGHKAVTDHFNVEQMLKPTQSLYLQVAG